MCRAGYIDFNFVPARPEVDNRQSMKSHENMEDGTPDISPENKIRKINTNKYGNIISKLVKYGRKRSDHGLRIRLVWYRSTACMERPSLFDLRTVRSRINFWRDGCGLYIISLSRVSQCARVLKVSVLETNHTLYCSISRSDPLRQSRV